MLAGESLLLRLAASGDAAHLGETSLSAAVSPAMSMMPHPASTRAAENAFSGGGGLPLTLSRWRERWMNDPLS